MIFDVTKQQKRQHQQWKNMQEQSTRNSNNQRRMHTKIRQLDDRRAHYKYTRRHTMSTNDDINDNDTFTRGPEASKSHAKHKARWREGRRQLDRNMDWLRNTYRAILHSPQKKSTMTTHQCQTVRPHVHDLGQPGMITHRFW